MFKVNWICTLALAAIGGSPSPHFGRWEAAPSPSSPQQPGNVPCTSGLLCAHLCSPYTADGKQQVLAWGEWRGEHLCHSGVTQKHPETGGKTRFGKLAEVIGK